MIIFLEIVGELASIIGSVAIYLNASFNSILEISNNGYKIEKSVLDKLKKKQFEEKKQKSNLADKILETVLLLVPGVNLINASIKSAKVKKMVMNDQEIKENIVPMTEEEKEQYAKMEGKIQKLMFTAFIESKETDEEFLGFNGKRPIVIDQGLTFLDYEKLMPLNYTLNEVKRLNEATGEKIVNFNQLLSIYTRHLFAPTSEINEILNFITKGEKDIDLVYDLIKKYIDNKYPFLSKIDITDLNINNVWDWLEYEKKLYGNKFILNTITY